MTQRATFMWGVPTCGGQSKAGAAIDLGNFNLPGMIEYVKFAEELGIEGLLMGVGYHTPDPIAIVGQILASTKKMKMMVAYRAGAISPTLFTQMINTLSFQGGERIALNLLAGISPAEQKYYGDFLSHDKRYARLDEFISVCRALWHDDKPVDFKGEHYEIEQGQLSLCYQGGTQPDLYLSGNSDISQQTAINHGATWLRYSDTAENIAKSAAPALAAGIKVGIRMSVIVRPTREEALAEIDQMMSGADMEWKAFLDDYVKKCDSVAIKSTFELAEKAKNDWLNDVLWTGAIPFRGGPALALVGSPDEVANYIMEYKRAGVSTFLFSGWPQLQEMEYFAKLVIPKVRELEAIEQQASCAV
ncbi:LLM class flavin-dependent oxidoreductase (plasmid) [Pseudoalteromonas xiamenensis]|uniref:LLM class flavin-dependent oxidoreductase n=1 Tax=Pseudoalteromonas xiamenensis TaxID=882626 RepID=UPI0027E543D3|nr:LLM class flavin-dependent oxidoreductase [Pseudoalteromonas xiamenensis]WMN61734.1 LLM class flavin-dependent oxidoreductase [Pseudoalteromonas xiamenensis]